MDDTFDPTRDVTILSYTLWQHKSSGSVYRVIMLGRLKHDGVWLDEPCVVYQDLRHANTFVRGMKDFLRAFTDRFEWQEDHSVYPHQKA